MTGLYLHIPFCRHLCPYCDFAVAVRREPPFADYVDAMIDEYRARRGAFERPFGTVYFGGGTPGLLPVPELARLLDAVADDAPSPLEVTLEANPRDVGAESVRAWRDIGVTRVSIGVQSFDDEYLARLGRDHTGEQAARAVETAIDAGLDVTMDLIWGGPEYDASILGADLARVESLGPAHVSAYELTVEENTVFGRRHRAGDLPLPGEDALADHGGRLVDGLRRLGLERYEVSSYARGVGHRAIHNSGYWLGRSYLGVGLGAHSLHTGGDLRRRRRNLRRLPEYMSRPRQPAEVETLAPVDHLRERLFLAARTTIGVTYAELRERFVDVDESIWDAVARWHEHGVHQRLLEDDSTTIRATPMGLDYADTSAAWVWDFV